MIHDIEVTYDEFKHREAAAEAVAPRNRASLPMRTASPSLRGELHPVVYKVIMGLALWFALAVWGFVAPSGYTDVVLTVVTLFVLVAVALPFILSRIARRRRSLDVGVSPPDSLPAWLAGDLDTQSGRIKGLDAAAGILLPLLAGAVGMTAFAVALHLTVHHAS